MVTAKIVDIIFTMNNNTKYQTLLISSSTTVKQIQEFLKDFDKSRISQILQIMMHIQQIINKKSQPHMKMNSLLMLIGFAKMAHYPLVFFIQNLLIKYFYQSAKVAAKNNNQLIYDYFEMQGYPPNTQNLQSISFHFTRNSLLLILLISYLHPKRMYKNREFNVQSLSKRMQLQLFQNGLRDQEYNQIVSSQGFLNIRKQFMKNLISFNRNADDYVQTIIKIIQKYLVTNIKTPMIETIIILLKSHDAYICTELVPRLAEIFCYHNNFRVKKDCLTLINDILYSGDLEALVILNFTEYFKIVALKIADASLHIKFNKLVIFPQINGQVEEKRLFLNEFLLTVERLAKLFPTLEAYFLNSGESPLSQIYRKLIECNARFPKWQGQNEFYSKINNNFRNNKEYNQMFLQELDRQKVEWLLIDPLHPTFRSLLYYIQRNLQNIKKICHQRELNPNDNEWIQLIEFNKHFEQILERISDDFANEELQQLIWKGLNLKKNIHTLQQFLTKYQKGQIDKAKLKQNLIYRSYLQNQQIQSRLQQLGTSIKRRQKQKMQISINQKQSIIKSKVNLRIQELASKKNQSCEIISQLDIYSRSFIANKIHSEEILKEFTPIVYFHPLRKQKRINNGIKLCSQDKKFGNKQGNSTPKFRSYLLDQEPRRSKKGLKILQKQGVKYDRYLQVLNRREWIKYLTCQSITILDKGFVKIQRSELRYTNLLENQILQITFTCFCSQGGDNLRYTIHEQSSIEVKQTKKEINANKYQIEIKGLWIKFGYQLPTISFFIKNQVIQIPLPFSFNNYIYITPLKKEIKRNVKSTQKYRLDKKEFPYIQSVKNYLRGIKVEGNKLIGFVKFFNWECNLKLIFDNQTFYMELESSMQKQDDILLSFLPLFLARLFSVPA